MNTELRTSLLAELADIERQLHNPSLTDSDRQQLDQAWEDTHDRLDDLDGLFIAIPAVDDFDWHDAREVLDTPPPASPVRLAPPPPPPLSSTHIYGISWRDRLDSPDDDDQGASAPSPPRQWEDDREDCSRCPGCHYCTSYGYDGGDEV